MGKASRVKFFKRKQHREKMQKEKEERKEKQKKEKKEKKNEVQTRRALNVAARLYDQNEQLKEKVHQQQQELIIAANTLEAQDRAYRMELELNQRTRGRGRGRRRGH